MVGHRALQRLLVFALVACCLVRHGKPVAEVALLREIVLLLTVAEREDVAILISLDRFLVLPFFGEFLADDFFLNYGNAKVRETVQKNNPTQMKKLFNMFNEIYNDGTNQTQSVIVVTILGSLYDDETLLANCVDYMGDMTLSVIETNKLLRKKSVRAKLEHPPLYKPKKQKKTPAFLNSLNGGN